MNSLKWIAGLTCLSIQVFGATAPGASGEHWVATWSAAAIARSQTPRPANNQKKKGPPQPPPVTSLNNQTVRQIVHTTIGGGKVRVVLTNAFGTSPLEIGAAHVALRGEGSKIEAGSDRALTFSGRPATTIPAGAMMISDPVNENVPVMGDLAIDVYLPNDALPKASPLTVHNLSVQTNYVSSPGNFAGAADLPVSQTTQSWFFLARVEVTAPEEVGAVVTFGDSITDGTRSTPDTNSRWPDQLAKRFLNPSGKDKGAKLAVLNAGIAGNRLLDVGVVTAETNALERLDRDALDESGATYMVVLEGINDIRGARENPVPGAEELIAANQQLIARAHARGIKVFGATLTPFEGASNFTPQGEAKREALNHWIRTSKAYDGVIDFDATVRDPQSPTKYLPAYDSGDHLHPSDMGYAAMANSIDLSLFDSGHHGKTQKGVKISKR